MVDKKITVFVSGILVSLLSAFVLIMIFSYVSSKAVDPEKYLGIYGALILFTSAFVGGITVARRIKSGKLSGCMIFAFLYVILLFIISLFFGNVMKNPFLTLSHYIVVAAASFLSAVFSGSLKGKGNKLRKKYKKLSHS